MWLIQMACAGFSISLWRQAGSFGLVRQIFEAPTDLTYADQLATGNLTEHRFAETVVLPASVPPDPLRIDFSLSATNPLLGDGAVTRLVGQWSADMASWTTVIPTSLGSGRFRVEVPAVSGKVYARLAVVPIP